MAEESREISVRLLLKFCLDQDAENRMESYRSPQELKEAYPDMKALDKKVYEGVAALQKEEKIHQHKPLRMLKRTFLVAAILMSIFSCMMLTSADVRNAIVNTIIDWTGRDVGFQFVIEGEPLSCLPGGYGPHYVPDGFEYQEENSLVEKSFFELNYMSKDESKILSIGSEVLRNSSQTRMDNEHTDFEMIRIFDTTAYIGRWTSTNCNEGYFMLWQKDGIVNQIYGNVSFSELLKIAQGIY